MRIVVDGHCRLKAYQSEDPTGRTKVAIRYLKAESVRDAMLEAARRNSKDKLKMSKEEKMGAAWRIVIAEEGRADRTSKRDIALACGCAPSTVGNMRQLLAKYPPGADDNPRAMTWRAAQRIGVEMEDFDEDARERRISELATKIRQAFGDPPDKDPELYVEAFCLAYGSVDALIADRVEAAREREEMDGAFADF
jgi:hypothetical protein